MADSKNPAVSKNIFSRRSLLSWLGRGAVLSLGGAALASCLTDLGPSDGGSSWLDGGYDGGTGGDFPFEPGSEDHPVFSNWGERTVDRQDLEQILRNWRLRVDGLVESAREYSFADLVDIERKEELVDFHCVEGWSIYDVPWNGLQLSKIFDQVGASSSATHVTFHTIDERYNESLPLSVALEPKTLLAYGIAGNTLPLKHGFPLRVVIPRLFGYKNAKYIDRIELTDEAIYGYWVERGYSYEGEVPQSRLRPGKY
jgi:DMSO/TMAO reductase YedYZ molybdopterin-dependent catalytic subunit